MRMLRELEDRVKAGGKTSMKEREDAGYERAQFFGRVTGKGKPMTYGSGKVLEKP